MTSVRLETRLGHLSLGGYVVVTACSMTTLTLVVKLVAMTVAAVAWVVIPRKLVQKASARLSLIRPMAMSTFAALHMSNELELR